MIHGMVRLAGSMFLFMESPSKCPSKMDWFSALVSLDIPWPLEGVAVSKSGMLDLEEI
jgi:hypothetical protein